MSGEGRTKHHPRPCARDGQPQRLAPLPGKRVVRDGAEALPARGGRHSGGADADVEEGAPAQLQGGVLRCRRPEPGAPPVLRTFHTWKRPVTQLRATAARIPREQHIRSCEKRRMLGLVVFNRV